MSQEHEPLQGTLFDVQHLGAMRDVVSHETQEAFLLSEHANPSITEPERPDAHVDIRQRWQAMIEELDLLANASRKQGFINATHSVEERPNLIRRFMVQRGGNSPTAEATVDAIAANMEISKQGDYKRAKQAHARVFGEQALILADVLPTKLIQEGLDWSFSNFYSHYGGPRNAKNLDEQRSKLIENLIIIDLPVAHKVPPVQETPKPDNLFDIRTKELTTPEKLQAIHEESRAGFITPSNREKQALALLDYLGNPEHPGGVYDHLREIADHHIKIGRAKGLSRDEAAKVGDDAVRSKLYEFGDYLANARAQAVELAKLQAVVANCDNPHVNLAELLAEIPAGSINPGAFIRYLDTKAIMEGKAVKPGFAVLRTTANRSNPTDVKHKTIEDPYTAEAVRPVVQKYINQQLAKLTVGEVRALASNALEDQQKRALFWKRILQSVRYTYRTRAQEVLASLAA